MTKNASHVHSFTMYVPTEKSTNVDMEWMTQPTDTEEGGSPGEVDIGHIEEMKITSLRPSSLTVVSQPADSPILDIKWVDEASKTDSLQIMRQEFYPFTHVPYESFNKSFELAKSEKKLVHHILLWGAMDDQSC